MTVMMIVGCLDEEQIPTVGNGKTLTSVAIAYDYYFKYGRKIYTNFTTTFSEKLDPSDMIDLVYTGKIPYGSLIILDEIQQWLESAGKRNEDAKNLLNIFRQHRKIGIDIIGTLQRYRDLYKRVRAITDYVVVAQKFHVRRTSNELLYTPCMMGAGKCSRHHYIKTVSAVPNDGSYSLLLDVNRYKSLYDTNEKITYSYEHIKVEKEDRKIKEAVSREKERIKAVDLGIIE